MKYIFLFLISITAFAQNAPNITPGTYKVFINGQAAEDDIVKLTRWQLKDAVISLDPAAHFPAKTSVACFEVVFPEKPNVVVGGSKLTLIIKNRISRLKPGDTITIQNLKYEVPGDKTWHKYSGSQKVVIVE